MKKITTFLITICLVLFAKITISQEWTPVYSFNSPNGGISTSNNGKLFAYVRYINDSYEAMLSLDNGDTWSQVHEDRFSTAFFNTQGDLYAVRQKRVAGVNTYYPHRIYLTTDDGANWITTDTVANNPGQVNASVFRMDNRGTLYTGFRNLSANIGGFKCSTDDGASWTLIPTYITLPYGYTDPFSALLTSNGDFFITTYNEGIYKSTDAGENWTSVFDSFITLAFLNEHPISGDLYAASYGAILKSTDQGENWIELTPDPWMAMNITHFEINADGTFYFANSGGAYKSVDAIHWESVDAGKNRFVDGVHGIAISDDFIYIKSGDSTVYRKTRETLIGINDVKDEFSFSIYPNPANEFVTVKVEKAKNKSTEHILSIADINGRLVYQVDLPGETNKFDIDISGFMPGLYMVNINEGRYNYKQKLVITK